MPEDLYAQIPETLTLRELQFVVTQPGYRAKGITVTTTLTDPVAYAKEEIAALFGCRRNVELDIRAIKQTLHLDHILCKSPAMVLRHLWVTRLAYNLIRVLMFQAARVHRRSLHRLSFAGTVQRLNAIAPFVALLTGNEWIKSLYRWLLQTIADDEVPDRPNRVEPRALKRRHKEYDLLKQPRSELRRELMT